VEHDSSGSLSFIPTDDFSRIAYGIPPSTFVALLKPVLEWAEGEFGEPTIRYRLVLTLLLTSRAKVVPIIREDNGEKSGHSALAGIRLFYS